MTILTRTTGSRNRSRARRGPSATPLGGRFRPTRSHQAAWVVTGPVSEAVGSSTRVRRCTPSTGVAVEGCQSAFGAARASDSVLARAEGAANERKRESAAYLRAQQTGSRIRQ
jgi:hypothetical protein